MANWRTFHRQLVILSPVYAIAMMLGCAEGWLANAIYFFVEDGTEISASLAECEKIASVTEIGRLLFAIPSGFLVDRYGRKKILAAIHVLNIVPGVAMASSKSIWIIYMARFIVGINYSLSNASILTTIGEIASPEIRGQLVVLRQICIGFGMLLPCVISILFSSYWTLVYTTCVLSFLSCLSSIWLIETPHHLIRTSRYEKAKQNLIHCRPRYEECDINREFENLKEYIEAEKKIKREINWLQFVKTKSIRNPLATAMLLVFFQSLIGTHVVVSFITLIIPNNEHISKKFYPLTLTLVTFFPRFCAAICIDRFPRRILCMSVAFAVCIIQLSNALSNFLYFRFEWEQCFWIFALGNIIVKALVSSGVSPLTNTMKSEIFPQTVKGFGAALCLVCTSFGDLLSLQLFGIVKNFGLHYLYIFYALASLMFIMVVYLRLPESRAKTLADIQQTNYIKVSRHSKADAE